MNRPVLKLSYNAPVTLTFALLALTALVLDHFTGGWTTVHLFSVYRCSLSDPLAFFRFCCSELLATLIRQANSLHLPLSKTSIQHLITITSPEEFSQQATQIVSDLCEIMRRRISEEDSCLKRRLIDYILTNFKSQDLSIQSVAEGTGIPRGEISTLLKEETGQGFVQYVSYLRLNEFKRMLEQSDLTIRELVLYVGYNDVPNFLRKFKFLEGMTPGQYRQLHRKQP